MIATWRSIARRKRAGIRRHCDGAGLAALGGRWGRVKAFGQAQARGDLPPPWLHSLIGGVAMVCAIGVPVHRVAQVFRDQRLVWGCLPGGFWVAVGGA